MDIGKIKIGDNVPEEFNAIIEITKGGHPVKYEIDKESGALILDRVVATPMYYPFNYGFIPHTLADDGDPLDVLLFCDFPVMAGAVVKVRPIGVLHMEDESGGDEKILCVPAVKVDRTYENINTYEDLSSLVLDKVKHFFENYKDLEAGKWVKLGDFRSKEEAQKIVMKTIAKYKEDNLVKTMKDYKESV